MNGIPAAKQQQQQSVRHEGQGDAMSEAVRQLNEVQGKSWMACIYSVEPDPTPVDSGRLKITLETTTWQFPHQCHDEAVNLLRRHIDERINPPVPDPLELADFLRMARAGGNGPTNDSASESRGSDNA